MAALDTHLGRFADLLALPFFAAMIAYFWKKPLRDEAETGFLYFCVVALVVDSVLVVRHLLWG